MQMQHAIYKVYEGVFKEEVLTIGSTIFFLFFFLTRNKLGSYLLVFLFYNSKCVNLKWQLRGVLQDIIED